MAKPRTIPLDTVHLVRDSCLCLHTQRAARAMARRFDTAFQQVGLTNGQFSLLISLNRPQPPRLGEVATLLAMDRTTLTAALKALERRGLVRVAPDAQDRRSRRLILTEDGRDIVARALPIWFAEHKKLEQELTTADADAARMILNALGS